MKVFLEPVEGDDKKGKKLMTSSFMKRLHQTSQHGFLWKGEGNYCGHSGNLILIQLLGGGLKYFLCSPKCYGRCAC